jgi:AGZA family xanthine/uracil permease-like MFS transporter
MGSLTTSGIFVYTVLNGLVGFVVFASRGYIEPREYDLKEYWTWKGSGRRPWFVRAIRRRHYSDEEVAEDAEGGSAGDSRAPSSGKDEALPVAEHPLTRLNRPQTPTQWHH